MWASSPTDGDAPPPAGGTSPLRRAPPRPFEAPLLGGELDLVLRLWRISCVLGKKITCLEKFNLYSRNLMLGEKVCPKLQV